MHFRAALWNIPEPSFKENCTQLIWSDPCPIYTAFFSPPPPFFFLPSKTNVSSQVFWSLCLPKGSTGFVSGPGGGTVVNAVWLTDSHLADSGSDWPSPRSGHMAAEYSSLHPFLVLSPTVPFCCTRRWEWVLGFVSCFQFTPVRQLSRRACCVSQGWL